MHELISITLAGHTAEFPLDNEAYDLLKRYLDRARARLAADPDRDEVLGDLEASIGERLASFFTTESGRVAAGEMADVLASVGDVETGDSPGSAVSSEASEARPRGRFLCRIREGRWFGGICLGVAVYGQFDVNWVRTIFLVLGVLTGGVFILVYLALLILLSVVPTVAAYEQERDFGAVTP